MAGSIPFAAPLREHHLQALNLINVYFLLIEGEMLPGYTLPAFLQRLPVRMLMNRMEAAPAAHQFPLAAEDAKVLYAAWLLGNKLIATSRGEYIGGLITQQLPAGHPLKEFRAFRDALMQSNNRSLADADTRWAAEVTDLPAWKQTLEQFVAEPGRP